MYCDKCGRKLNDNDKFCTTCGAKVETSDGTKNTKPDLGVYRGNNTSNNRRKLKIVVVSTLLFCIVVCIACFAISYANEDLKSIINIASEKEVTDDTSALNETEDESLDTDSTTGEPTTSETSTTEKVTETTTEVITVDAGKLYRPTSEMFCNQYTRYISGYFEGQDYAKMRFGPSKSKYNVVGQIDNGNIVTVETKSIDGWTMVYYEGKEGWVRTDFLFETYEDCFPVRAISPDDYYASGYPGYVDVTGEYDGEPLNMRTGPSKDYQLITTVPDGAEIEIKGTSLQTDEWTYIEYNEKLGWVLTKYIFYCETGDKPVLYLYPEKEIEVDVSVDLQDMFFTCTYPEYNQGWSVVAKPDGTLINKIDGKEYSYLYWELGGKQNYDFSKGFVIKGNDTAKFLQKTLSEMGLTPKEYNEFIVYWLPKMQKNEYNLISFQYGEYTDNVKLNISPKPDSMLRVFMAYKALDEYIEISPQVFNDFERKGFTVVEWGGVEVR